VQIYIFFLNARKKVLHNLVKMNYLCGLNFKILGCYIYKNKKYNRAEILAMKGEIMANVRLSNDYDTEVSFADSVVEIGKEEARAYQKIMDNFMPNVGVISQEEYEALENMMGDTKYQIIGERGAEELDIAEEVTFRLDNLQIAREMEQSLNPNWNAKRDENALKIKMATGWERGADGKWRYEVELNLKLDVNSSQNILSQLFDIQDKKGKTLRVSDIVSENLSNLYPDFKDIKIELSRGQQGSFAYYADFGFYGGKKINLARLTGVGGNSSQYTTILHEIQHAIQDIEGFGSGGSAQIIYDLSQIDNKALVQEIALKSKNKRTFEINLINSDLSQFDKGKIDYIIQNSSSFDEVKKYFSVLNEIDFSKSPVENYNLISGEAEARNAEKRALMTAEERRNTLLSETEDVAREDQIFLYDNTTSASQTYPIKHSNGSILGLVHNGKVYINPKRENLETRMHEYGGHLFFAYIKENNRRLFDLLDSKFDEIPQDIKDSVEENYPELEIGSPAYRDEVMSTYMGKINREGVKEAIKKKGLLGEIARYMNKIYNRLMRSIGMKDYLDIDNFMNLKLDEALVYIGDGILKGKIRLDVTSDDLASIMSANPKFQKDRNYFAELLKGFESLYDKAKSWMSKKTKDRKDEGNKVLGISKIGFYARGYGVGVTVDAVYGKMLNVDSSNNDEIKSFVQMLASLGLPITPNQSILSLHYSNGVSNVFDEGTYSKAQGIQGLYTLNSDSNVFVLDTSEMENSTTEGYARGRIFVFTSDPTMNLQEFVNNETGLYIKGKGYRKIYKNGKPLLSTSEMRDKIDREALENLKEGDVLELEVPFDNSWNQEILRRLSSGEETMRFMENIVINMKVNGKVVAMFPATYDVLEKESKSLEKEFARFIRGQIYNDLINAIKDGTLETAPIRDLRQSLANGTMTQEEYNAAIDVEVENMRTGKVPILPFISEKIPNIRTKGRRSIHNLNESSMAVQKFINERTKIAPEEKWEMVFYDKETDTFLDRDGNESSVKPNSDTKHSAIYLVGKDYQGRVFMNDKTDTTKEDWLNLENNFDNLTFTYLDVQEPILDNRVKIDYSIAENEIDFQEPNKVESNDDVTTDPLEAIVTGEKETLIDNEGNEHKMIDDAKDANDMPMKEDGQTEETTPEPKTDEDVELFVRDIIPYYMDNYFTDESRIGENMEAYTLQERIIRAYQSLFDRKYGTGINFSNIANFTRDKFKNFLNTSVDFLKKGITFKEYLKELYTIKNNGTQMQEGQPPITPMIGERNDSFDPEIAPLELFIPITIASTADNNFSIVKMNNWNNYGIDKLMFNLSDGVYIRYDNDHFFKFPKTNNLDDIYKYFEQIYSKYNIGNIPGSVLYKDYMGSSNLPLTEDNYEAFVNSFELNNLVGKKAETDNSNITNCE
jgi:hypothetical protein